MIKQLLGNRLFWFIAPAILAGLTTMGVYLYNKGYDTCAAEYQQGQVTSLEDQLRQERDQAILDRIAAEDLVRTLAKQKREGDRISRDLRDALAETRISRQEALEALQSCSLPENEDEENSKMVTIDELCGVSDDELRHFQDLAKTLGARPDSD